MAIIPPNPSGLCMCGCGLPAPIAPYGLKRKGWVQGEPTRFIHGHNTRKPPQEPVRYPCECGCGGLARNRFISGHNNRKGSIVDRFWANVVKTETCWLWTAGKTKGYGKLQRGQRGQGIIYAHRFAYELLIGPIPPGLELLHSCDTPACVNPAHLRPGTHAENMADMAAKGLHPSKRK